MMIPKKLLSLLFFITLAVLTNAQCVLNTTGTLEGFEGTVSEWTDYTDATDGIFTEVTAEKHSGNSSLQVEVLQASTWKVRIFTQECNLTYTSGMFYRVTYWAKGDEGKGIRIVLEDGGTEITQATLPIVGADWKQYTHTFEMNSTYTDGEFRFVLPDVGTYYIDDLSIEETETNGLMSVDLTHENIRYNGVVDFKTLTPERVSHYRLAKDYAEQNGYSNYAKENALGSSGVVIEFKTASPTLNLSFEEEIVDGKDVYWHEIVVFKDDEIVLQTNEFDFSLSNPSGEESVWEIAMPIFTHMDFVGLEISEEHPLLPLSDDDRLVYVSIGNSITHGVGQTHNATHLTYPYLVADSLDFHLFNWGIGGSSISDKVFDNFTKGNIIPDVVTLLWGYNDVHYASQYGGGDSYITNTTLPRYKTLLANMCKSFPDATILAILPTSTDNSDVPDGYTGSIRTIPFLRQEQKAIITELQATYDNLIYFDGSQYTSASDPDHLADDVHLNDEGAKALADQIIQKLYNEGVVSNTPETSKKWYVAGGSGVDNLNGTNGQLPTDPLNSLEFAIKEAWEPGDTIFVMNGTYQNEGYGTYTGDGSTGGTGANNPAFLSFNNTDVNTSEDAWLVITNYKGHTPKIQFDGAGGIIMHHVSYIDISGLEIEGPNQKITKQMALNNRLRHDAYFSGRGIAVWGGDASRYPHHIKMHHMKVHDCPNSGLRVNDADYCEFSHNEVYNCTWWSSNAESAIVFAQSKDYDEKTDIIKMRMTHNLVYNNRNFIPFYAGKQIGSTPNYGTEQQDFIHDGQGVYITRNNPGSNWQSDTDYNSGWWYLANNIAYDNGINGLVVHLTNKTIVCNNLVFNNGATSPVPVSQGGEGRQNAGGLTINGSKDVFVYNNISWTRYADTDYNYQVYGSSSYTASNNLGINGKTAFKEGEAIFLNPDSDSPITMFMDTASKDFRLAYGSIAIDAGIGGLSTPVADVIPLDDFDGTLRDANPDIGPFEYVASVTEDCSGLVANGCFEDDLNGWKYSSGNGASANFMVETTDVAVGLQALKAEITALGTNAWDNQIQYADGWASVEGNEYQVTFYAKSNTPGAVLRMVQQNSTYSQHDITTTSDYAEYTWNFTAKESGLVLKFHFPEMATFFIDDIRIEDITPEPVDNTKDALTLDLNTEYQEMIGFGGALSWYTERVTNNADKEVLYDLMFEDLGMDILRLKNWYFPDNYPTNKTMGSGGGFEAGVELFNQAKLHDPTMEVLLCSWTPPASLKENNSLKGTSADAKLKHNGTNFMYSEFAEYNQDMLQYYAQSGFYPDYLSIQNEPGYLASWETCEWRPTETADYAGYDIALDSVYNRISKMDKYPLLIGAEVENLGYQSKLGGNSFREFSAPLKNKDYMYAYAYHLYNFGSLGESGIMNETADELNIIKDEFGDKPAFMTEFSKYSWFNTALMIHQNLTEANTSAYIYWELVWDQKEQAMIGIDNSGNYTINAPYYTMKHFSKYIDKGYIRVDVQNVNTNVAVTAFKHPTENKITYVLINRNNNAVETQLGLEKLNIANSTIIQSVEGNYDQNLGAISGNTVNLSSRSITTISVEYTKDEITQEIQLTKGWNLISLYIEPSNDITGTVFSNASVVKTFDVFWDKNQEPFLNSLNEIKAGEGYLVYNEIDEVIEIKGAMVEGSNELTITEGWNLIGVPSSTPIPVSDFSDVELIKDFDLFYKAGETLNTLTELKPGKAYFLKASLSGIIKW